MTDQFARQTATQAHTRITQAAQELADRMQRLEKIVTRRAGFAARSALCGEPCRPNKRYCHGHSWAEGTDD